MNRLKIRWFTVVSVLLLLIGTGWTMIRITGGGVLKVRVSAMKFRPVQLTAKQGVEVKLVLDNADNQLHDFAIDVIPAIGGQAVDHSHDMKGHHPDIHLSAAGGEKQEVTFTPLQEGMYRFYCTVPGHRQFGMEGYLVVK